MAGAQPEENSAGQCPYHGPHAVRNVVQFLLDGVFATGGAVGKRWNPGNG